MFPVGNQFLEVVAPVKDATAAGRYLERRGGDGGYMVILQCDDHGPRKRRVEELGIRRVIEHDTTVATQQPGPHGGGGKTTAYSFSRGLLTYSWCLVNARFTLAPRSDTTARRKTRSTTS